MIDKEEILASRPTAWEKYDDEMEPEAEVNIPDLKTRKQYEADLEAYANHRRLTSPEALIETMLREYEFNYYSAATKRQRWPGQERWQGRENEEMRLVNIMHPYKFLRKLRAAGVDARESEAKNARIWLNPWSRLGRIGVNAWVEGQAKTITTLQYPYGPEYSVMRFNEYNVPTNERYRGWRTALLALIISRVLTEDEVHKAFGPATGEAAVFYLQQLKFERTIRMGLTI